jgi:hypothetical protein
MLDEGPGPLLGGPGRGHERAGRSDQDYGSARPSARQEVAARLRNLTMFGWESEERRAWRSRSATG